LLITYHGTANTLGELAVVKDSLSGTIPISAASDN
jgi:hypothetical protein